MSYYRYPYELPVGGGGVSARPDLFPTGHADFIKFQAVQTDYKVANAGRFNRNVPDNGQVASRKDYGPAMYLYMPQNLSVTYAPQYNQVGVGIMGAAVANALGGELSAQNIADQLQTFAGDATSEVIFNSLAKSITNLNSVMALNSGDIDGNTLMALASGKIFNPFQEQIFAGIGFRTFNFDFKMVARSKEEGKQIAAIIKYLKRSSLPRFSGSTGEAGENPTGVQNLQGFTATSNDRYLSVPNRFRVSFCRMAENGTGLEDLNHFKMDLCVITNISVNYTPDGQYVALHPDDVKGEEYGLFVPAVNLSLSLTESSIMTSDKVDLGF